MGGNVCSGKRNKVIKLELMMNCTENTNYKISMKKGAESESKTSKHATTLPVRQITNKIE